MRSKLSSIYGLNFEIKTQHYQLLGSYLGNVMGQDLVELLFRDLLGFIRSQELVEDIDNILQPCRKRPKLEVPQLTHHVLH